MTRAPEPSARHIRYAIGRARRRPSELPAITLWYLVIAWTLFLVVAAIDFTNRRELADPFGYSIGDLGENLPRALVVLPVATFVNVGVLQILYVTAILAAVSPRAVARDGQLLTAAVFLGTSIAAGLVAGLVLHTLDGRVTHPILDEAWERSWNGGSAGCYGLIGLLAARSRRPWLMLGLVGAWEIGLVGAHLRSFTPAFHVSALLAGFVAGRWLSRRTTPDAAATTAVPLA
ncbi:MAG: hypothetical protein WD557_16885 [Dehalococcoidia bacterium]